MNVWTKMQYLPDTYLYISFFKQIQWVCIFGKIKHEGK